MHLLRDLYLSFNLSLSDLEALKQETMNKIQANPSLVQLLKTPSQVETSRVHSSVKTSNTSEEGSRGQA